MKTYNYKSLAQAAGISPHILRLERKKLFENKAIAKQFGEYEHNILTPLQLEILINNIPLLKKVSV